MVTFILYKICNSLLNHIPYMPCVHVPTCQSVNNHVKGVLNFQTFFLQNARGNFYTIIFYEKFCIILDIIVIHMIGICIVHENCIILHFYTLCILKKNVWNFCFFETFLFLNKKTWFLYITSNKGFLKFSSAKIAKKKKKYL